MICWPYTCKGNETLKHSTYKIINKPVNCNNVKKQRILGGDKNLILNEYEIEMGTPCRAGVFEDVYRADLILTTMKQELKLHTPCKQARRNEKGISHLRSGTDGQQSGDKVVLVQRR